MKYARIVGALVCAVLGSSQALAVTPCGPKRITQAVMYDPFYQMSSQALTRARSAGACRFTTPVPDGRVSLRTFKVNMTSREFNACREASRTVPRPIVYQTLRTAADVEAALRHFGAAETSPVAAGAAGVAAEAGSEFLGELGGWAFVAADLVVTAVEASCFGSNVKKIQSSANSVFAMGGQFMYEQRIFENASSLGDPVFVETAYYKTWIGKPDGSLGEWRVVPIFALASPVTVNGGLRRAGAK